MKQKSHKIIFSSLFLLSLFLCSNSVVLADGCDNSCPSGTHCVTTPIEGTGATNNQCVKDGAGAATNKINFTAQIPFGDKISSDDIINGAGLGMYIKNVYKYSVGIVGILATIVIMWGGVRWLTAGGNQEAVKDAQDWIKAAISGLVLILSSYFILNFVNPDLVNFKLIKITPITGDGNGSAAANSGTVDNKKVGDTCATYGTDKVINFENSPKKELPSECKTDELTKYFNESAEKYKIDAKLLKALAMGESSCRKSLTTTNADTGKDDCGIMQLQPGTAGVSCTYLNDHPDVGIDIAARILSEHKNLSNADNIAGYNTGYGPVSISGKKAALATSDEKYCGEGVDAYECCLSPGGLYVTQSHVTNVMGYYKGQ